MQPGQNQQAYDRGITIFSPDGRLYQVEYAREAVKRGTAAIGVRTDDGVVLAVDKRVRSDLMERNSVEKLHEVDDHLGLASAGHVADGRRLVDFMRRDAQRERLRHGEAIRVETATKAVTDFVQQYTQIGGARPFGVALLVAGVDDDGTPRLFETDPSGTPYEWQAVAVGADRREIQDFLEEHYDPDADLDGGIDLALRALDSPDSDGLNASGVGIATVDVESPQYRELSDDEIESHLQAAGVQGSDDEDSENGSQGTGEGPDSDASGDADEGASEGDADEGASEGDADEGASEGDGSAGEDGDDDAGAE